MKSTSIVLFLCVAAIPVSAQDPILSLRIADETIPAGQVVQIKVEVTEPKPISGGKGSLRLSNATAAIQGIAGFSPNGDLSGVAMRDGDLLTIRCIAPSETWGLDSDYPILTIATEINPGVPAGSRIPLRLARDATLFRTPTGQPYPQEISPGELTVSGTLAINNIVPGGGPLPVGTRVQILGSGFRPDTKIQVNEILTTNQQFINSGEIDFTLAQDADLTGTRIRVENDNDRVEYYSYLRPQWDPPSNNPLLASAIPVFPTKSFVNALYVVSTDPQMLTGIGIQNPNASDAAVTVALYTSTGSLIAQNSFSVAGRHAVSRELSEWLGAQAGGAYVRVSASPAVQVTGMRIDETNQVVLPLPAYRAR